MHPRQNLPFALAVRTSVVHTSRGEVCRERAQDQTAPGQERIRWCAWASNGGDARVRGAGSTSIVICTAVHIYSPRSQRISLGGNHRYRISKKQRFYNVQMRKRLLAGCLGLPRVGRVTPGDPPAASTTRHSRSRFQWMWNLRLSLGHMLYPAPMRTTEFASAATSSQSVSPLSLASTPSYLAPCPILWGDWQRRSHRRELVKLLRNQRVDVRSDEVSRSAHPPPPRPLSHAQRAHWRLSWKDASGSQCRSGCLAFRFDHPLPGRLVIP
jgi:hypothetical protein